MIDTSFTYVFKVIIIRYLSVHGSRTVVLHLLLIFKLYRCEILAGGKVAGAATVPANLRLRGLR